MARGHRTDRAATRKAEGTLTATLLIGIGVPWAIAGALFWVGQLLWVDPPAAFVWVLVAMLAAPLLTVVVVITVAAVLGGRSLSRHGWVLGLVFSLWFFVGLALVLGGVLSWLVYAAGWVVVVGLFWLLGWRTGTPMWVGGTRAVPVLARVQRPARDGEEDATAAGPTAGWLPAARRLADAAVTGADVERLRRELDADGAVRGLPAARLAAAGAVPYLVWRRLTRRLQQEHGDDFPRGAAHYLTPLYLSGGRSASGVAEAQRLCRLSHRAMERTELPRDGVPSTQHGERDAYVAGLVRRGRPDPGRLVDGCLAEAVALLDQRDVVLEVARETRAGAGR
ncbi:hypothetical protein [Isoptericola sp. NPDC019482]|uniref:hypothetical protein n=1 Tax=Isoptericola sp. NPDC019482 TaxID=3154688 RepID=UPI00346D5948